MRICQTDSVYYFRKKPSDVVHCSGGGHHNIICTEPVRNVSCQSAIAWTEASRINAYVWLHKHTHIKCKIGEVEETNWSVSTHDEDALSDTVKSKFDNSSTLILTFKSLNVDHICEIKLTNCFAHPHQRELKTAWYVMAFKVIIKSELFILF